MNFGHLNLRGIDEQTLGAEGAQKIRSGDVPVLERMGIARNGFNNFELDNVPLIAEAVRAKTAVPAHMVEHRTRRSMWSFLFENCGIDRIRKHYDGRNGAVRRNTEIVLENTLNWLISDYLPKFENIKNAHSLFGSMSAEQFIDYFSFGEGASVTQYPANVLGLVRQLVPTMISRQIFSFFGTTTPSAVIPVLTAEYGEDHAPFSVDGENLLILTPGTNDFWYSGGRITGYAVGSGDGADTTFDLPISGVSNLTVYVAGVVTAVTLGAGAGTAGTDLITFAGAPALDAAITADFDTSTAKGLAGREVDMRISTVTLSNETTKLTFQWDYVDEQDAQAFHGVALSPEGSAAMQQKIMQDTDALILRDALQNATAGDALWYTDGYLAGDTDSSNQLAYEETIVEMFVDSAEFLFLRYDRYPTWAVVGSSIASRLQKLGRFKAWPMMGQDPNMLALQPIDGSAPIGILDNKFVVYQTPNMPATRMLMGWTPANPFDVTYAVGIYLPYFTTGDVTDGTGNLKKYRTDAMRYGKKVVKGDQMATGTLTSLA